MSSMAQIMNCLRPFVGSGMLPYLEEPCDVILTRFAGITPKADLSALGKWLPAYLYNTVRKVTRGSMLAGLDSGRVVTLRAEDFSVMADDMMYCLFSAFPRDAAYLMLLRDYSLRHESLSALRALYMDFRALISDEESTIILKVIQQYPSWRYAQWLQQSSPGGTNLG